MQFYAFFGLHSLGIGKRVCYQELLKPLNTHVCLWIYIV